jgi:transposase-like protein
MVKRGGRVVASKVPDASALSLMPHIEKRVLSESVVYTDEWKSYIRLARSGYQHWRIQHAQEIYVMGDMHTKTIEEFWSLVNRGITETHHAVSAKWLQVCLNECAWRYSPPRRLAGDVPDATFAIGDDQPVMTVAWRPSLGRRRPPYALAPDLVSCRCLLRGFVTL